MLDTLSVFIFSIIFILIIHFGIKNILIGSKGISLRWNNLKQNIGKNTQKKYTLKKK